MKKLLILLLLLSSFVFGKSLHSYEEVRVTHSEPIYKYVTVKKPIQECYEEEYLHRVPGRKIYEENSNNSIGIDTIIGATAGVVIGNQIGKGNGRDAAKIVGGLLGGAIANNMRDENVVYGEDEYVTRTRTKCVTRYEKVRQKRVIKGYKNYFIYNGVEYFKITKKSKRRIKVSKTITF